MTEPIWVGDVLHFWFEELGETHWWAKSDRIDGQVRARFFPVHEQLVSSDGAGLRGARQHLAGVVVLDQFSRNMYRGSPRAFAADHIARRLARHAIEQGFDGNMSTSERLFLYLPFEHSEDRDDQALAVQLISTLGNENWTRYAEAHRNVIERFGRFPHRNAVLDRTSTAEELASLKDPMGAF